MPKSSVEKLFKAYILIFAILANACAAVKSLDIKTGVGTIHGFVNSTTPNVAQFLGIPFAEPPVGPLRWLPSTVKAPVDSIDAKRFSPSCPQFESSIPTVLSVDARGFLISGPTSEDCLTLNIWAPMGENCPEKLPVLVWIYGGSFQTGGGQTEYQIPANWVEKSQGHIVVGIKYLFCSLTVSLVQLLTKLATV
jgi:acetylcholinesterase